MRSNASCIFAILAAHYEHLAHDGFDLFDALAEARTVHRHIAPAQQLLAFGDDLFGDDLLARGTRGGIARQEQHPDPVLARGRQVDIAPAHLVAQELVGDLQQDTRAVAGQRIGADRAAMGQIFQDLQTLAHHVMALLALDMGHKAHPAGIALLARIV